MKKNSIYTFMAIAAMALSSCGNEFLDKLPDRRTDIDTPEKAVSMLVSAYPDHDFQMVTEFMSDNVDDYGLDNPNTKRYLEQVFFWQDVTETDNESPENYWSTSYSNIASANLTLDALDRMAEKSGWTSSMKETQAEALLCRAYGHFILVNLFAMHYNAQTADKDLGVTIMLAPETELSPDYQRNTVAECYKAIADDIEKALPNVGSSNYTVPKYHFNEQAAYAFACRFYLYYEKWEKAIEYADKVLGANPKAMLRDYELIGKETAAAACTQKYIDADLNCNLLLATAYSQMGKAMTNYSTYKRFAHVKYNSSTETATASHPWGAIATTGYYTPFKSYSSSTSAYTIFWRVPYLFEYTDAVAGTGYSRTVFPLFTTDEVLLNRAEAYVMLKEYDKACDDINLWVKNIIKTGATEVTPESVTAFYNDMQYCYEIVDGERVCTPKKHLHPSFAIDEEGSTQESMLQCVINARRIEQLELGMRWFDVKRFGIVIPRRLCNAAGVPDTYTDWLEVDDPRRAIQIPLRVRDAGYTPNQRRVAPTPENYVLPNEDPEEPAE